jgi:hypothetical protein
MPSEFDLLVKELQHIQLPDVGAATFAKALPSRQGAGPVDIGKINASIRRAEAALAQRPAIPAALNSEDKWKGFFKSLATMNDTFGARVAAGSVSSMDACKIEASLHRLANNAFDALAREKR